jgi:MFS family permease
MVYDIRRAIAQRVYYGWVIVLACLLASTAIYGTSYGFSVFYDVFIREFEVSRTRLAFVFGLQTALIYTVAVGAGKFAEQYGQRRLAGVSTVLMTVGLVWTAVATSILELTVAFGVLTALGMAGFFVVGFATVPLWFYRRRGAAAGIAAAGLGVGLVIVPPGANQLISAFGWRTAMFAVAVTAGTFALLVTLLFADHPSDVGADISTEFPDGLQTTDGGTYGSSTPRELYTSPAFLLVFVGWALVFAPQYVVMSHIILYATDAGIGRSAGVLAIAVIGTTITISRTGIGYLSDSLGRTRAFVFCGALMGGSVLGLAFTTTSPVFLFVVVLFAVGYGGSGGLVSPIVADLFGNDNHNVTFSILAVSLALAGLAAPPLAGFGFELTGSYELPFVAFALAGVIGACSVALAARLVPIE